jgi:hypothetical protein
MYNKTVSNIWDITLSDLIEINEHLLTSFGRQIVLDTHDEEWEQKLRLSIKNTLSAINVMHRLGVPVDSDTPFKSTKWASRITIPDVNQLIEANLSLDWIRNNRNDVLA